MNDLLERARNEIKLEHIRRDPVVFVGEDFHVNADNIVRKCRAVLMDYTLGLTNRSVVIHMLTGLGVTQCTTIELLAAAELVREDLGK